MISCPGKTEKCINCHDHFQQLRPLVKEIIISKHFSRDLPDFDVSLITDCNHFYFKKLHKFEEIINGNHIFRAIKRKLHIVYAIDKNNRLIFLRAFENFLSYKKFLNDKKQIAAIIESQ